MVMNHKLTSIAKSGAAALAGVVVCCFGSAGLALADPQSTPTITLAPYVLKGTILEDGPTRAYRPWFENGARTGDLIEYHISQQGERCTSVAVGTFPPDDNGNALACPHNNWSARGAFPDKIDSGGGILVDDPDAATYWKVRNVFMFRSGEDRKKVDFWWDKLTTAQKNAVDPISCALDIVTGNCTPSDGIDHDIEDASIVLNYIRGDRSLERDKQGGIFRLRYSLLGAIINSRPAYVPVGDGLVVVGANDGYGAWLQRHRRQRGIRLRSLDVPAHAGKPDRHPVPVYLLCRR
jgi:Tfp pilus tip-associated adhesin PilY1